jgi:hypothetical protein
MFDTNHLRDFAGCFRIRAPDPVANSEWGVFEYLHCYSLFPARVPSRAYEWKEWAWAAAAAKHGGESRGRDAKHAEWVLERMFPNEFARTDRIEQVGEAKGDSGGIKVYLATGELSLADLNK